MREDGVWTEWVFLKGGEGTGGEDVQADNDGVLHTSTHGTLGAAAAGAGLAGGNSVPPSSPHSLATSIKVAIADANSTSATRKQLVVYDRTDPEFDEDTDPDDDLDM